jgi:hypothetical protein
MHKHDDEYHQAMLEREERLDEALIRLETNQCTEEDINIIRFECGKPKAISRITQPRQDFLADIGILFSRGN